MRQSKCDSNLSEASDRSGAWSFESSFVERRARKTHPVGMRSRAQFVAALLLCSFFFLNHRVIAAAGGSGAFFLPAGDAAKIVTVSPTGEAAASITVLTQAVAVKETGPKETVEKFGEVYAFSPAFVAVHREQPTQIEFWNLQPDDEHDFALVGPDLKILMYQKLPPLKKTSFVFTFHREGLIDFKCLRHQPAMSGQILVLPPAKD
jgi:plastocyanin